MLQLLIIIGWVLLAIVGLAIILGIYTYFALKYAKSFDNDAEPPADAAPLGHYEGNWN